MLAGLEFQQVGHVLAAGCAGCLRQFVCLEAVHATVVGEEQDPIVRGADEEVAHHVVLLEFGAAHAFAAALLVAVGVNLGALRVARGGDGHHNVFAGDEVFLGHIAGSSHDLGAAIVAVLIHDFFEFVAHNGTLALWAGENIFQVGDDFFNLCQFINDFLAFQGGETAQLHSQNGIGLDLINVQ